MKTYSSYFYFRPTTNNYNDDIILINAVSMYAI